MRVWIIEIGEPLPVDPHYRPMRDSWLSNALQADGHDVVWWTSTFDHVKKTHRFGEKASLQINPRFRLEVIPGPGYGKNISLARLHHQRVTAENFAKEWATAPEPDIVVSSIPTLECALKAVEYGRRRRLPVVVDVRDLWPDVFLQAFPVPLHGVASLCLVREFRRIRRICQYATCITGVSDSYLAWALRYAGRAKTDLDRVFPLGYPTHVSLGETEKEIEHARLVEQYGIIPGNVLLVFFGTFGFSYDLEILLKAARILYDEGRTGLQFVLCGDGDKAETITRLAKGLPNVVLTGWVGPKTLRALLEVADIGLAPYVKKATQSLPNKPFEYFAGGLPVMSCLKGDLEHLLREEELGWHYQAEDVASFLEGLRWLIDHPEERRAMGAKARKLLTEQWAAEIVYDEFARHILDVASRGSSAR
jgi:glycosyltransferase involved in cell wall biosynthesis